MSESTSKDEYQDDGNELVATGGNDRIVDSGGSKEQTQGHPHGKEAPLVTQPSPKGTKSILDVPRQLYDELSQALGIGEERDALTLMTGPWTWRMLNPDHPVTGTTCAIAFHHHETLNANRVELWTREPRTSDRENPYSPPSAIAVLASTIDGGVWAYGTGTLMRERAIAVFGHENNMNLTSPFTRIVGLILARAGELAKDPNCVANTFWTGHHDID